MREMRMSNETEQVLCISVGQTGKLSVPHRVGKIVEKFSDIRRLTKR